MQLKYIVKLVGKIETTLHEIRRIQEIGLLILIIFYECLQKYIHVP